jgi:hypothetical protein
MHIYMRWFSVENILIFPNLFMLATNQSQPISLWISQSALSTARRSTYMHFWQHFHQTYVSPFVDPRILGRAKRRSVIRLEYISLKSQENHGFLYLRGALDTMLSSCVCAGVRVCVEHSGRLIRAVCLRTGRKTKMAALYRVTIVLS